MKFFRLLLSFLLVFTLAMAVTVVVAQEGEGETKLGTAEDLEPTQEVK